MSYRVIYAPRALDDLREIYAYIAWNLQAPDTAKKQVGRIRQEIRELDEMPFRCTVVQLQDWDGQPVRRLLVDRYAVFYAACQEEQRVTVYRIVYTGRDLSGLSITQS